MVSKSIYDLGVGVCLGLQECSSIWLRNSVGHNGDVVSAWEDVCNIPHRIKRKVFNVI